MKIIKDINLMKSIKHASFGFVPTMGALHEGHVELIKKSKMKNDFTCVSIFVNPTQFNNLQDFKNYPDRKKEDLEICKDLEVDYVFTPDATKIYGEHEIKFVEEEITSKFEGEYRPGHFSGVLQVVLKLLNIVEPSHAYFGKKDYQQYLLIKKMSEQFFLNTKIVGVDTVRDKKGLALSSRNYNLSPEALQKAQQVAAHFLNLNNENDFRQAVKDLCSLEYYGNAWGRVFVAHFIEGVRLIDNKQEGKAL